MRIIAGQRRGLLLSQFDAEFIRPTKDIVKEFIYNCLANLKDISKCSVCDLFAGTGGLGLEAISRGSSKVTFVEIDLRAVQIIRKNILKLNLDSHTSVVQGDALHYLEGTEKFDIIMADPPYDQRIGYALIEKILKFGCLNPGGVLVIETSPNETFRSLDNYPGMSFYKQKKWGESFVTILRLNV